MARSLLLLALACGLVAAAAASAAAGTKNAEALAAEAGRPVARSLLEDVRGKRKIKEGEKPGKRDTDGECGEWKRGTATGYSTDGTDKGDLPMAPNDLGEYIVPGRFFKAQGVLAVDWADWEDAKYRYVEVSMEDKVGTLEVWDFCNDKDCAKGNEKCCSSNKKTYPDEDGSGYLLDIETHALKDVWGLENGHNWLVAPAWYRVCGKFDYKKEVEEYDMVCRGIDGKGKCGFEADEEKDN